MELCSREVVEKARAFVAGAVRGYLRANCRRILSLARAAEQSRVRVEMHGPFRYYEGDEELPRFLNAFEVLFRCLDSEELEEVVGGRVAVGKGEEPLYIEMDVGFVEELCREEGRGEG